MEILLWFIIVVVLLAIAITLLGAVIQILWALFVGAIVGAIAAAIVGIFQPVGGPQGCLATALAGIGGSLLATILVGRHGFIASIIGAVIVVVLWKALSGPTYVRG